MTENYQLKLYKKPIPYFGYPNLGSNYSPNLVVGGRIGRFLRTNSQAKNEIIKYLKEIVTYYDNTHIIPKSGILHKVENYYQIYLDDLMSAKNITVTLINSTNFQTNTNVTNIKQPTFHYDKNDGMLSIYPFNNDYLDYGNIFVLTANITKKVSIVILLASFIN